MNLVIGDGGGACAARPEKPRRNVERRQGKEFVEAGHQSATLRACSANGSNSRLTRNS